MNRAIAVQCSHHLDRDFRIGRSKAIDDPWKQAKSEVEGRSQADPAGRPLVIRIGGLKNFIDLAGHSLDMRNDSLARRSQGESLWSAIEHAHAEARLEALDATQN